ncbi:MAG: TerC family protein, partial [Candidatus Puniceispirillaceae bacterium]
MTLDWFVDVAQIIFADIILSGDNALVIGMAAAGLSANLRKRAIFIGMAVAAALRIVFAVVASYLLAIKGILIIGGLLLAWVCWRFYNDLREFNAADADVLEQP